MIRKQIGKYISTRNLTNIKPANAPQSGSGLDIGEISYLKLIKPIKGGFRARNVGFRYVESWFLDARIFIFIW